ncbi:hypothetical protein GCM10027347_23710 [Larkinella harenae]
MNVAANKANDFIIYLRHQVVYPTISKITLKDSSEGYGVELTLFEFANKPIKSGNILEIGRANVSGGIHDQRKITYGFREVANMWLNFGKF